MISFTKKFGGNRSLKKYPILLIITFALIVITSGTATANQTVMPSYSNTNLTVSNDEGARFDVNGDDSYSFFKGSGSGGLNSIKISDMPNDTSAKIIYTNSQSGIFYIKNTGGKGYSDDAVLMLAVNGTIPDNFMVNIQASGYQWAPILTGAPSYADKTYNSSTIDETFNKTDFIYGPQIWKPYYQANYPLFEGQNMNDSFNTFSIIFIDLYAGILKQANYAPLIDNGTIKVSYLFQNLPLGSLAAFNVFTYALQPETGQTIGGIAWTNRVNTVDMTQLDTSGYYVNGITSKPIANFSATPIKGKTPLTVNFKDLSTGNPTNYAWDFTNDGVVESSLQNPSYIYHNAGNYTVKLMVNNTEGNSEKTIIIITSDSDIVAPTVLSNLQEGYYNSDKIVILMAADDWDTNPKIFYTLDGTIPTTSSTHYSGPINLIGEGIKILKFFAIDSSGNPSDTTIRTYIIDKTAPIVSANPAEGTYNVIKSVLLTVTDTNPTTIHYTIDGSDPRSSSTRSIYNNPITIYKTTNLIFAALDAAGNWSPLYNLTYAMFDIAAPLPSADLPNGSYNTDKVVKLAAIDELDPNPKIYYTLDGTNPTTNSSLYNWPISINLLGTTILKFIAVDAAGHISDIFTRIYILDKAGASGTWNSTTLDANVMYNSIAMDSSGYPHIAYFQKANSATDFPDLKYAFQDHNGWYIETLETTQSGSGYYVSLALDSLGFPHIAYSQLSPDKLKYAFKDINGWYFFDLVNTDVSYVNLALYQDNPRISYFDNKEERLKYIYKERSEWVSEIVTPNATYGHWNSLALNHNGNPRISYYAYDTSRLTGILMYAKRSPTGLWQIETVDNSADTGPWNSVVIDSLGNPHISYNVNDGSLKYAYWNETNWIIETVDNLKSVASKLILDKSGNPRIVYKDFITGNLKYAYKEDSKWFISNIDTVEGVGNWIFITMNQSGMPWISYMSSNSRLKYANLIPFVISADPRGGSYNMVQKVNLTSTSGTTIYYTTDGSDPRISSSKIKYIYPVTVNKATILKFTALDSASNWSSIHLETYNIIIPIATKFSENPVINGYIVVYQNTSYDSNKSLLSSEIYWKNLTDTSKGGNVSSNYGFYK